jgi:hypothetical protein
MCVLIDYHECGACLNRVHFTIENMFYLYAYVLSRTLELELRAVDSQMESVPW